MAENYLITGYHGTPHVTAENDRGIYAGIFGAGRFVLPVGEQFRAEYIGNNTVRVYDGKLIDNGAAAGIPAGKYVDLLISEAAQGMNRNDLIVFQYKKNTGTLVESGEFVVVKGTETTGTANDPALTQADLLSDEATLDQMALWRVKVSTATISAPVQVFNVLGNIQNIKSAADGKAPKNHASTATTYGVSTASNYGHAKASATTPKAPGTAAVGSETSAFSRGDHVHPEQVSLHGIKTAGTGAAYTATVEGITELVAGASFIMIPHTISTSTAPTLNVNGLGAKSIRRGLSNNNTTTVASTIADWLGANKPVRVTYNGLYWIADLDRPMASDIYGSVGFENGGHGGTTVEEARENLGIITLAELPNLYVWKKYSGEPDGYSETEESNVRLMTKLYNQYTGSTTNQRIFYADSFEIVDGKFSLANGSSLTAPTAATITAIRGKYAADKYASGLSYVYLIPENAVFTDEGTGSSQTTFVKVDKATKIALPEFINMVASKTNDTYPTNGKHTDGYWYVYNKQLGE